MNLFYYLTPLFMYATAVLWYFLVCTIFVSFKCAANHEEVAGNVSHDFVPHPPTEVSDKYMHRILPLLQHV